MLKKVNVSQAISLIIAIPTFLLCTAVALLMYEYGQNSKNQQLVIDIVNIASLLDGVAHTHAVERGTSAGFLGSKGQVGQEAMLKARQNADTAENKLKNFDAEELSQYSSNEFNYLRQQLLQTLAEKNRVRKKVDALTPSNGAFDYYSRVNKIALSNIQRISMSINDQQASTLMSAKLNLLWMKERAGQYRGALNGAFKNGKVSPIRHAQIMQFVNDEQNKLDDLTTWAPEEYKEALKKLSASSHWGQVANAVQSFSMAENLDQITGPSKWFEIATKRIGDIKSISDKLSVRLQDSSQLSSDRARIKEITLVVVLLISVTPLIFIGLKLRKSICYRVKMINQYLSRIDEDKDFNQTISDNKQDELSEISRALNSHVFNMKTCLGDIKQQIMTSSDSLSKMANSSSIVESASLEQQEQNAEIVESIKQMTEASNIIAKDMAHSAELTDKINRSGKTNGKNIEEITRTISALEGEIKQSHTVVQEVAGNTEAIGSILQTIEAIAEQTNLLALNAAIEAARAGDQGRGFAVVADEVRNLAKRTQDSTEEINQMIESLISSAEKATNAMESCLNLTEASTSKVSENKQNIGELFDDIESLNASIEEVASAIEEQSTVSIQVNGSIQKIEDGSMRMLDASKTNSEALTQLSAEFDKVLNKVKTFKLN
ncbi:methyl-accepting chemotaxis protein [Agaribacter flavus]|uniref:Methyl-accepting chemotaxis protein n=1 Tax=Agaribacter flavus TaxID=1902781 RepID=A0ABV7FUL3_9ALTE